MNWIPVVSSNVEAIAYDPDKKECYVLFNNGQAYAYLNVSQKVWEEFNEFSSKGKYVQIVLRKAFPYRKMQDVKATEVDSQS